MISEEQALEIREIKIQEMGSAIFKKVENEYETFAGAVASMRGFVNGCLEQRETDFDRFHFNLQTVEDGLRVYTYVSSAVTLISELKKAASLEQGGEVNLNFTKRRLPPFETSLGVFTGDEVHNLLFDLPQDYTGRYLEAVKLGFINATGAILAEVQLPNSAPLLKWTREVASRKGLIDRKDGFGESRISTNIDGLVYILRYPKTNRPQTSLAFEPLNRNIV